VRGSEKTEESKRYKNKTKKYQRRKIENENEIRYSRDWFLINIPKRKKKDNNLLLNMPAKRKTAACPLLT